MDKHVYNEIDPFAAQWLKNLMAAGELPAGEVDERSIKELTGADLAGVKQFHAFAGIGGWPLALRLAGWPEDREVWTGSCPCQPFSSAGKQKGTSDDRHLWPDFLRLITERRPATIFGEQVASKAGRAWGAGVRTDLEALGYAVGLADISAAGIGAPHIRQRLWWVAHYKGNGWNQWRAEGGRGRLTIAGRDGNGRLAENPPSQRWLGGSDGDQAGNDGQVQAEGLGANGVRMGEPILCEPGMLGGNDGQAASVSQEKCESELSPPIPIGAGAVVGLADNSGVGLEGSEYVESVVRQWPLSVSQGPWGDFNLIPCKDGKARRVGCGVFPLADGIPRGLGQGKPELRRMARSASRNRVGRLKGYGNAIVPELAALFIRSFMEISNG